jgi:hypothetical protein
MANVLYLDQNVWVMLARGAWDKSTYPNEHAALSAVIEGIRSSAWIVPLSYSNIYETAKINDPIRRAHMAYTQATISKGCVFRGRRRIFTETLEALLASHLSASRPEPESKWYLSDLWFEAAGDSSPSIDGFEISPEVIDLVRAHPQRALFDYLTQNDESVRKEAVRRFSLSSAELLHAIETRRELVAGEKLAVRKRAYAARQMIDELDFILVAGRRLGQDWHGVADIGSSLLRRLANEVPVLRVERELVIRLEDQTRPLAENDLRDMSAFTTVLPLADILVAEKPFVNLARQARLGELYGTTLLTSVFDLASHL